MFFLGTSLETSLGLGSTPSDYGNKHLVQWWAMGLRRKILKKVLLEDINISDTMDRQEDHQRMNSESGAIIVARKNGGRSRILMIEEPTDTKYEGAPT